MPNRWAQLPVLEGAQLAASSPDRHAALSASAGTGKTQVLSARVIRLLLRGADPSAILCLTFTKAGAAEMADRVHARLAQWVRLDDNKLRKDLFALGERNDDEAIARARTLFARVLDAPGGGLRVQTIHAFAASLLASFPGEAGLVPGFRALDAREEALLARETLARLLAGAEERGDLRLLADVQRLSRRLGEGEAESFLLRAARADGAMAELGPREGIEARLRERFSVPLGDVEERVRAGCADGRPELDALQSIARANAEWGAATGLKRADAVADWLGRDPTGRADGLEELLLVWLKSDGEPRKVEAKLLAREPDYPALADRLTEYFGGLAVLRRKAALTAEFAAALRAGQAYALAYRAAKRAAGAVDFDDLIERARELLTTPGMGDWVRYRLDQETDHILVDEAQDTNARQWEIVLALASEYFAGEGARNPERRTLFTVGDYKQAIFGFQGTDPEWFGHARAQIKQAAFNAELRFDDLSLEQSFRTSPPVLELVDRTLELLGPEKLGLERLPPRHRSATRHGYGEVTLLRPVSAEAEAEAEEDSGEEGWAPEAQRVFAERLAKQIKRWLTEPFALECRDRRQLRPDDVMILVRKRGQLASLLVARLHAEGVPVAGVDRLRLSQPLAIKDLLAAMRFAVQPHDDLNLASLLVSPLFGWSQEQLLGCAYDRGDRTLWESLRERCAADPAVGKLCALLAQADYQPPHAFLECLLSGALQGRRKLLERLGVEAGDPIDELVNAALEFEASGLLTLQSFLDWFDRGDVEIVRDPSAPLDAVRLLTVHGAKGLQAPLVILADATGDPDDSRGRGFELPLEGDRSAPLFRPRASERFAPLDAWAAEAEADEREEHWRLLYVALTRAEERLVVGGALGPRRRGAVPEESWHKFVEDALDTLGAEWTKDECWGRVRRYMQGLPAPTLRRGRAGQSDAPPAALLPRRPLPEWATRPPRPEAKPSRPLAPSAPEPDQSVDPPPTAAMRDAARRGTLLHALFERLPGVAPERRREAADRYLGGAAKVDDAAERAALIDDALRVIEHPAHAALFAPDALAEAPLAAVVPSGAVVSGTVDRLLVGEDVIVADFKTGRRPPEELGGIPDSHLKQMAAYREALHMIFPGRTVRAMLLYTAGPRLFELPDALLDPLKP